MRTFAAIDVETTGLSPYRHDRVIEIGVVAVSPGHGMGDEFSTLLNPGRDIGPTSIHGLTTADVADAPQFHEVASHLAEVLRPSVALVGHYVAFDVMFLRAEFERSGLAMPTYPTIDTCRLAGGGTLGSCCAQYGIEFDGRAHEALGDARAAARLFEEIVASNPALLEPYEPLPTLEWPKIPFPSVDAVLRVHARGFSSSGSAYLQQLIDRRAAGESPTPHSGAQRDYFELLDRVLEDRRIDANEGTALTDLAYRLGLTSNQLETIHLAYLSQLARVAWADGHVTDSELRELQTVCGLLGFGRLSAGQFANLANQPAGVGGLCDRNPTETWVGRRVCFTGECQCSMGGEPISRERAEALTRAKGLVVQASVTKKLDLLIVADPDTQSTKARKARQYGIRIVHEPVFWRTLGVAID